MLTRIMYIESKAETLNGPDRIGRVRFSKSKRSYFYGGREFLRVAGYKYNCLRLDESGSSEEYWISGPRRDGQDRLYKSNIPVEIDEDVREEYWTEIRRKPELKDRKTT